MPSTPRFDLQTWLANQIQPNQVFNPFLLIATQAIGLQVLSKTTAAQPGSPANFDSYILPTGKSGAAWTGFAVGDVAFYWTDGTTGGWTAFTPPAGLIATVADEGGRVQFDGSTWNNIPAQVNNQTGSAYELELGDQIVEMENAGANTVTIPANASKPFAIGTVILVSQIGAGATSIAITSDTLLGATSVSGQYGAVLLYKRAATTWLGIALT
jgi:hypothetical protein